MVIGSAAKVSLALILRRKFSLVSLVHNGSSTYLLDS
ncbi:hypothetical protein CsSME_00024445 [Camellia sinensis var. sinensis]